MSQDEQQSIWAANMDHSNNRIDNGLYVNDPAYRQEYDYRVWQNRPVVPIEAPILFPTASSTSDAPAHLGDSPSNSNYSGGGAARESSSDGVSAVGLIIVVALATPVLAFMLTLGLSRLEPWTWEANRLLTWWRGTPSDRFVHTAVLLGVLLAAWLLTCLALYWNGSPGRRLAVVLVSFAATELLIGWQMLSRSEAFSACPGFYPSLPEVCTTGVWQQAMRLVTWCTTALDVNLADWAMAGLAGIAGLVIGVAVHATLLAVPLIARD